MVKNKKTPEPSIDIFSADTSTSMDLPFAESGIVAGFPSPAQDYMDLSLDLNKEIIKHPYSTFYGRVKGNSMIDAGINEGDVLVIDKSLEYRNGLTAVCFIDGEFTIKTLCIKKDKILLVPANKNLKPIEVSEDNDFTVWGIVTYVIKKMY